MPAMHSLAPDVAAQNRGPAMMAVMYSFTALTSLTVVGRVFSRYKKLGHLAIDDYVIILSLVGSLFCSLFLQLPRFSHYRRSNRNSC
jgi:hypothetical protein